MRITCRNIFKKTQKIFLSWAPPTSARIPSHFKIPSYHHFPNFRCAAADGNVSAPIFVRGNRTFCKGKRPSKATGKLIAGYFRGLKKKWSLLIKKKNVKAHRPDAKPKRGSINLVWTAILLSFKFLRCLQIIESSFMSAWVSYNFTNSTQSDWKIVQQGIPTVVNFTSYEEIVQRKIFSMLSELRSDLRRPIFWSTKISFFKGSCKRL